MEGGRPVKTIQDIIDFTYKTRWQYQKDGEKTKRNAEKWQKTARMDILIRHFTQSWVEAKKSWWAGDSGLSNATINRRLAALSCAFKTAYDAGVIDTAGPRFKPLPENGSRDRVPTRDEVAKVLRGLTRDCRRIARTLYRTGVRPGELWEGEFHQGSTRGLMNEWGSVGASAWLSVEDSKNNMPRSVPIPAACHGSVTQLANYIPPRRFFEETWRRVTRSLDMAWFTPYCLRHARATELVRAGTPIPVVAKILGHRDWTTTMRYTHPNEKDMADAINARGAR
jgi:integrase